MSYYFEDVAAEIAEAAARYTSDDAFLLHVADLEGDVWQVVSLCVGDREFPDEFRQEALSISAIHTVRPIAAGIEPLADTVAHARAGRWSPMVSKLGDLFARVRKSKIETRFGVLSDDPREIVSRRDAHDLSIFRRREPNATRRS